MLAKDLNHKAATPREQSLDDSTLWLSFKKGNDLAFSLIYNKYVQRLYNYGMQACRNRDMVMDCLQEMFTTMWDRREHLADVKSVNFYLIKSFRRMLINRLKTSKRFSGMDETNEDGFEFSPSFEDVLVESETSLVRNALLKKGVDALTKRQREAVFLRFFNQLSCEEVAAVMNLHVDSVYNLISKAIESLRKKLKAVLVVLLILFSFPS